MANTPSDKPAADGQLAQFLTFRLARLHNAMNAQAVALLAKASGITLGQWRMIALVASGEVSSSRDLSRIFGFDPAFVSRTVGSLEAAGLMTSKRSTLDKRLLELEITEAGRRVYEKTLPTMRARQAHLLDALNEEDREVIFTIFNKLETAAERRTFD